jgi:hypothetical protein
MVVPGVSSVGDIIALCTLVTSTFTALHSTHGSQAEWLHVHKGIQTLLAAAVTIRDDCKQQLEQISGVAVGYGRELESLKDILQQIKQEAQQCQILMEEFRKAFKSVIKIFEAPAGTLRLQRSLHKLRYPLQHSDSVHNFQREFKDRLFALHIRFTVFNR